MHQRSAQGPIIGTLHIIWPPSASATLCCRPPTRQVFDEDGKDRTPKSMLGQPALQAAHGALPKLGESFQAGGALPGRAGDTAWYDGAAAAEHAGAGAPPRPALTQ